MCRACCVTSRRRDRFRPAPRIDRPRTSSGSARGPGLPNATARIAPRPGSEHMSALTWIKRRAVEREIDKLRQQLETARLAIMPADMNVATWFKGVGLSLASGFVTGATTAGFPTHLDRDALLRLLVRASSEACSTAAAFIKSHPPDGVSTADGAAPNAPAPSIALPPHEPID